MYMKGKKENFSTYEYFMKNSTPQKNIIMFIIDSCQAI